MFHSNKTNEVLLLKLFGGINAKILAQPPNQTRVCTFLRTLPVISPNFGVNRTHQMAATIPMAISNPQIAKLGFHSSATA